MKKFITFLAVSMVCAIGGFTCSAQRNVFVEQQSAVIVNKYKTTPHWGEYPKNAFVVCIYRSPELGRGTTTKRLTYYIVVGGTRVDLPDELGRPFYEGSLKEVELVKWYNAATNEYKYTIRAKKAKDVDLSVLN